MISQKKYDKEKFTELIPSKLNEQNSIWQVHTNRTVKKNMNKEKDNRYVTKCKIKMVTIKKLSFINDKSNVSQIFMCHNTTILSYLFRHFQRV